MASKPLPIRVDSLQKVYGRVKADHDLNGIPVSVALPKANQTPAVADFTSATVDSVTADDGFWTAKFWVLIGPGGAIVPAVGLYDFTAKLTDSPEAPVLKGGQVRVTAT